MRRLLVVCLVLAAGSGVTALALAARPATKAPTVLTATGGDQKVTLQWQSGGGKVGGYRVYRANADGSWPTAPLASTSSSTTTYVDGGLTNGTTYTYRVTALDTSKPPKESAPSNTASATPAAATAAGPCGTASSAPTSYDHVVWIVMENHSYSEVIGSASAPYENGLAAACGSASRFFAETHPSLPNYIAMTSGSSQGITDDNGPSSHPLSVPSIFSQTAGGWRSLQESMPSNCLLSNSGLYAVKHNPAAYYTNIATECATLDVPLGSAPDLSARFTFVTPNLCNDTHDCGVATGDTWLSTFLPKVFASPEYQAGRTAVFLTWDEDDSSQSNQIPTLVMAPSVVPGRTSTTTFNHYSMLRTTEELLGLGSYLGNAATATSMRSAFGI